MTRAAFWHSIRPSMSANTRTRRGRFATALPEARSTQSLRRPTDISGLVRILVCCALMACGRTIAAAAESTASRNPAMSRTLFGDPKRSLAPSYVNFGYTLWRWRAAWGAAATCLLCMLLVSCRDPAREPVTLRYPHGWRFEPDEISKRATLTQQFTQRTGIQIREMPQPESAFDQLDLFRRLLKPGPSGIDLLGIDPIWSATLESDLVDLAPYSTPEISSLDPQLLPSYRMSGKLVAIPYQVNVGALEYRSDLLR